MRGAPFLGWILVRGVWCADFGLAFGARCAVLGLDFGAVCGAPIFGPISVHGAPFWARKIGEDLRGNRTRDLSILGPWSWRMMPFWVDFGARCDFSGWVLVCGALFLRWILVRGAPFLG